MLYVFLDQPLRVTFTTHLMECLEPSILNNARPQPLYLYFGDCSSNPIFLALLIWLHGCRQQDFFSSLYKAGHIWRVNNSVLAFLYEGSDRPISRHQLIILDIPP